MKHLNTALKLATLMIAATHAAHASTTKWTGDGAVFNLDGSTSSIYQMELTQTHLNAEETREEVVVTTAEGKVLRFSQVTRKSEHGFQIVGDQGQGGGLCFGEGLCQFYIQQDQGPAHAITWVRDSDDQIRMLRTELREGKAQRFYREKLQRAQ